MNDVDRQIAVLMQATEMAKSHGERVGKAYARAHLDGGFSANEALAREIRRAEEEDAFLCSAALEILNA